MTVLADINKRIEEAPEGKLFFVSDFGEYDNSYVSKLLALSSDFNVLERLAKGVYYKPVVTRFGKVYPTAEEIVRCIAERDHAEILPAGEAALHALGFSTQVPVNPAYITTGSPRVIKIGNKTIRLKSRVPGACAFRSKLMPVLVAALKAKGRNNIGEEDIQHIRELVAKSDEKELIRKDTADAPVWIKKLLRQIFKETNYEPVAR
ncbi:MAG: DUF6088 family protein [Prevotella sp.]|nr:DUF6088 family protein [Prevotella sp.]